MDFGRGNAEEDIKLIAPYLGRRGHPLVRRGQGRRLAPLRRGHGAGADQGRRRLRHLRLHTGAARCGRGQEGPGRAAARPEPRRHRADGPGLRAEEVHRGQPVSTSRTPSPAPPSPAPRWTSWSSGATWDQQNRKQVWHQQRVNLTSDQSGMAVLKPQPGMNVQPAPAGDREGRPHRLERHGVLWAATRPPRRARACSPTPSPTGPSIARSRRCATRSGCARRARACSRTSRTSRRTITIYDPRGNKVQEVSKRTDDFGGLDGEFVLAARADARRLSPGGARASSTPAGRTSASRSTRSPSSRSPSSRTRRTPSSAAS